MKITLLFLVLVPFVVTGPVKPARHYLSEERNPNFKRYIFVENVQGEYEITDLRASGAVATTVELTDVEYDLYTQNNKDTPFTIKNNNADILSESYFDPEKYTVVISHGWNNNRNSLVNTLIKDAIFEKYDINLLIVDWSGPANKDYLTAKNAVVPVGQILGDFINSIQETYSLDGSSFILIGHSLGAHIVGCAGATTNNQIGNIIGLDPAGPLFSLDNIDDRLDITDAKIVQVIHTDGSLLGMGSSIGHVDYYPNGGMSQPGCGLDLAGTCSHSKAYKYMAEALSRGSVVFESHLCNSWHQFSSGNCLSNKELNMGQLQLNEGIYGDYYLTTNSNAPFGQS